MSRVRGPVQMQGFSLIEVLVAIVVLSIGLLGLAALQVSGLRVGQSSFYRAQAAQLATDMADRLRANAGEARTCELALGDATPSSPTTTCERDLAEWRNRLRSLPGGNGAVDVDPVANMVTVTVQWDDSRGGGADDEAFELVTRLWGN
ncbi:MAG: type IV pilus modification protein PilV [Burkholderiales bacterium]|nr:type IV pilus modification protein PilV [Burkholderiales bacterium]